MESTAINTVYVVLSLNIKTDSTYILKVFDSEIKAEEYKKKCYECQDDEEMHLYYIMEEIVY